MYQPIPISLDWLSFSVLLPLTHQERHKGIHLYCPQNHTIKEFSGTNIYKRRFILFNEFGDKVLTLLHTPHSKVIEPNSMFVEVANRELYSGVGDILNLLGDVHDFSFQSLSRIDIAGDFEPTKEQFATITDLQAGKVYAQGKREGSMFHYYEKINQDTTARSILQRVPRCMSWGAPTSDFHIKLYNKTKELMQTDKNGRQYCSKPYIPAMWLANGLPATRDIWRLECSLTSASTYTYRDKPINWDITNPENYTALYWDLIANRFTLRYNQGHKYLKNDAIAEFLPIPPPPHYRLKRREPHSETHHTDHATTLRALLKELDRPEVAAYPAMATTLLDTLGTILDQTKLHAYFRNMTGQDYNDFRDNYFQAKKL